MSETLEHVLSEYISKLKSMGYLTCTKTLGSFSVPEHELKKIPPEHNTPTHPILILAKCLPIHFDTKIVEPTVFEWSDEAKTEWYKTHGRFATGPRAWGSFLGELYRKLLQELIIHDDVWYEKGVSLALGQRTPMPDELRSLIHEYIVGPVSILSSFVSKLGILFVDTFAGKYNMNMSHAEDKMMFSSDRRHEERKLSLSLSKLIMNHPGFSELSIKEQEIQALTHYLRQEPYPFPPRTINELSWTFDTIRNLLSSKR